MHQQVIATQNLYRRLYSCFVEQSKHWTFVGDGNSGSEVSPVRKLGNEPLQDIHVHV